jgi:hypothetical protein
VTEEPEKSRIERPDVEMGARVKAKRLRFKKVPKTGVEFHGEPDIESDSGSERKNLPDEVEPGVTYRDVEVHWRAGAKIIRREKPD